MRRLGFIAVAAVGALLLAPSASAVHPKTVDFIAGFEGYYAEPYNDPAGFATVGYGHLIAYRPVRKSDRKLIWVRGQDNPGKLTEKEAKRLLRQDLAGYEAAVLERIGDTPVNRPMMTALTSFAFNLGPGYLDLKKSNGFTRTTHVAKKLRQRNYLGAARDMRIYDGVISGGKRYTLPGLTRRRNDEFKLMRQGIRRMEKCGTGCTDVPGSEVPAAPTPGNTGGVPIP